MAILTDKFALKVGQQKGQQEQVLQVLAMAESILSLTTAEACEALGSSAATISKLRLVGEHATVLRRRELLPLLVPEYSCLYYIVRLYKQVRFNWLDTEDKRVDNLARMIKDDVSRPRLQMLLVRYAELEKELKKP